MATIEILWMDSIQNEWSPITSQDDQCDQYRNFALIKGKYY
jgi:hypothetical protein